jgi:hypothetical protein
MRFKSLFTAAATALIIAVGGSSAARADLALPSANCGTVAGTNCLVFSDFNVYSLALLNYQQNFGKLGPQDPYYVSTNGTDLDNALVIGTGVGGNSLKNSDILPGGVVDDAFSTPNMNGGGTTNFLMDASTANTQGANIPNSITPNNSINTWDINVSSLVNYLNGGQLGFFFNLNQTNTTSYLNDPEDALGWMAVTLSDSTGQHQSMTFYLDGNNCTGQIGVPNSPNCDPSQGYAQNNAENSILPNPTDKWAYIHGQICMDTSGAVLHFGACSQADGPNATTVDQNLGASNAAFALYSDALQQWLLSGDYDKMSVDMRMAALDNGYEQLIIGALNIPEPITLMMFGAGLLGLTAFAGLRRRRAKAA